MGSENHQVNISVKRFPEHQLSHLGHLSDTADKALSIYLRGLNDRLIDMLNSADDHLFDKSGKSADSRHFAAMRTLRVQKDALVNIFKQELVNSFRNSIGKFDATEFNLYQNVEQLPSISSSSDSNIFVKSKSKNSLSANSNPEKSSFESLSLVDNDDLEEQIAIDSMVGKARKTNAIALEHLSQRLDTLLPNKVITSENNPFEPIFICQAFSHGLIPIEIDVEFQLVLYKYFERNVVQELDFIYQDVNNYFIERGVLPELKSIPIKRTPRNYSKSEEKVSDSEANNANSAEILNLLGGLLAEKRNHLHQHAQVASVPQQINTAELVNVLSNIQLNSLSVTAEPLSQTDIRGQISGLLPSAVAGQVANGALGQFNDDMIDVVTMLFDFILDDDNLHSEIKAVIARLQIPILKVGLVDREFFSNRKHSARLLLNELAKAGLSWDQNDVASAPMLKKIQSVVESVCTQFKDDVGMFEALLEDFILFKEEFQRRAKIFERRTREAEEGKARAESAKGRVNLELKKICVKKHVPDVVQKLFKKVWVQVMFLESLREDDAAWDRVCKVAKMLVWSVQPIDSQEKLQQLTKTIPVLIKNLNLGFKKVALSNIEASGLLDRLEDDHRNIIKKAREAIEKKAIEARASEEILRLPPKPILSEPIGTPAYVETEVSTPDVEEAIEIEEVVIEDIAFSAEELGVCPSSVKQDIKVSQQSIDVIANLSTGQWIELRVEGEMKRCKLAAKIITSEKYIFVNRSGAKIAEFFAKELAVELELGNMKVLDDEALFDRALESVISTLRTMKTE